MNWATRGRESPMCSLAGPKLPKSSTIRLNSEQEVAGLRCRRPNGYHTRRIHAVHCVSRCRGCSGRESTSPQRSPNGLHVLPRPWRRP
ncbi:hypothetical protein M404DRAFT_593301 [Pisolithus tinctorius Marx 270]|uniref:Uncharacterized protein n=1 Tax=Pisolithus tinctorius Marx 270 TaxID=870435 RepID=A0A0C3PI17_PISTI|nr:hypothetical protein M404DRAFT_593301 [Pisolithus tinctorius Marx 270]